MIIKDFSTDANINTLADALDNWARNWLQICDISDNCDVRRRVRSSRSVVVLSCLFAEPKKCIRSPRSWRCCTTPTCWPSFRSATFWASWVITSSASRQRPSQSISTTVTSRVSSTPQNFSSQTSQCNAARWTPQNRKSAPLNPPPVMHNLGGPRSSFLRAEIRF